LTNEEFEAFFAASLWHDAQPDKMVSRKHGRAFAEHVLALDVALVRWELRQRRSGRTTRQMKSAPLGSVYILPGYGMTTWAQRMAHDLGRADLMFFSIDDLSRRHFHGRRLQGVVLDHGCVWTMRREHWEGLVDAEARVR
jgi:hypothetical protein